MVAITTTSVKRTARVAANCTGDTDTDSLVHVRQSGAQVQNHTIPAVAMMPALATSRVSSHPRTPTPRLSASSATRGDHSSSIPTMSTFPEYTESTGKTVASRTW